MGKREQRRRRDTMKVCVNEIENEGEIDSKIDR